MDLSCIAYNTTLAVNIEKAENYDIERTLFDVFVQERGEKSRPVAVCWALIVRDPGQNHAIKQRPIYVTILGCLNF